MWTFLVADRRVGSIPIDSPNTVESYEVTRWGAWVPTVDVEALLKLERQICCGQNGARVWVKVIGRGNPTEEDMKKRPQREPEPKPIIKAKGRTRSRRSRRKSTKED